MRIKQQIDSLQNVHLVYNMYIYLNNPVNINLYMKIVKIKHNGCNFAQTVRKGLPDDGCMDGVFLLITCQLKFRLTL